MNSDRRVSIAALRALLVLATAMVLALGPVPFARAQDVGGEEEEPLEEEEAPLEEEEELLEEEEPLEEEDGEYREAYEGDAEEEPSEGAEEAAEEAEEAAEEAQEAGEEVEGEDAIPEPQTTRFVTPAPTPAEGDFQLAIPPVLVERRGGIATTAVFPLFYLRESPDTSELVIPPIYHREGREQGDVVFPIFWWLRGPEWHTLVIPPFWHHDSPEGHDVGIAPLFMSGRHGQSYYHLIPGLLTLGWGDEDEDYLFAGALFYRLRNRDEERWGLFPFLWWYDSPNQQYQFVAPFVFRHHDARAEQTLTIVPPALFYLSEQPRESWWGIAGLLHHDEGPGFHSTTIPPLLFHFSEEPDTLRLTTPLFAYFNERGSETLVTWLYQMHRGVTEADMVAPLFFWLRDPREQSETLVIPPLLFARWSSPASSNTIVFPFFGHFDEYGRRQTWITPLVANTRDLEHGDETTWVAPTIQYSRWRDGEAFNVHPIWYYEHVPSHRHYVFAPFWFDFEQFERGDRYTVAFPFYWRFVEGVTETQLFLNTYFRRREWRNERRWEYEFHFAPLFDYGQTSEGEHWWRVLYGLVGWEHRARHDRLWLFYIPIDFAHAPIQPAEPREEPAAESALAIPTYTLQ